MNNLINEQLEREKQQHTDAFKRFQDECALREKKNDGSNTAYARFWKKYVFEDLVKGLQMEIDHPDIYVKSSRATDAVKKCLGVKLVKTKRNDKKAEQRVTEQQRNYFDLNLCAFVALQMVLDNALAWHDTTKIIDRKTGKEKNCDGQRNRDRLVADIGSHIEQQLYFKYVDTIFPQFFKAASKRCAGGDDDTPRSSSSNWRYNMKRAIANKKEYLLSCGEYQKASLLDWRPFTDMQKKQVGMWLLSGCLKFTMLFKEEIRQGKNKQEKYIVLSDFAAEKREQYFKDHQPWIWDDLPMLCRPVPATTTNYGSWLTTVEQSTPDSNKGYLEISQMTLDYINNLQSIPYKINPFVAKVMDLFYERKYKLGKFVPHAYVEPIPVNQRLGLHHIQDREEQTRLVINHPRFKEARREKSKDEARQVRMLERAVKSRDIYNSMLKLRKLDEFYFPYSWDFRQRAYSRCVSTPSPQGPDYSKALLKFAIERPLDKRSKHYLSIELANNAGQDKLNFDQRLKWTAQHESEIALVATMLDADGDFSGAVSFLESIQKEKPWQFIAAAEEYYHCFIKKDRVTTSIRCGMDMSCSGAGLMAGIRRCKDGATLVNVYPTDEPQDLYRACWDTLCKLNKSKPVPYIRTQLLDRWTSEKHGRSVSKLIIMVAQYAAGEWKQMQEFYDYHDDLPEDLQFNEEEIKHFKVLWQKAMAKECSFSFVIDWFQARAQEIYDSGAKEIKIPTPTGSLQRMFYPEYKTKQQDTFYHGSMRYRLTEWVPTDKPNVKKWLSSIVPNAIHSLDGSLLAIGLHDFDVSFSTVHDAVYTYAGSCMDDMLTRLKRGYVEAVSYDIWSEFMIANGLDHTDPTLAPPIVGTLDLDMVMKSDYIFA